MALYQVVAAHWPAFRERAEARDGLPKFVVREFEGYLDCGRLDRGCLRLECRECGYSELVALAASCAASVPRASADAWPTSPCTSKSASCPAYPSVTGSARCPGDCARCWGMTASSALQS
jgi:hypothetical protein